jgi:cytoskeletal protein CcmA (bactofilin family)
MLDLDRFDMRILALLAVAALLALVGEVARADEGKLRRFGATVEVEARGESPVIAGGAKVRVSGRAGGDVWIGGAEVALDAETAGDAWVAGANVVVRGAVSGDLLAAGAIVEIANQTAGSARIMAARARISGSVARDIEASAATLELSSGASIAGLAKIDAARAMLAGIVSGKLDLRSQSARLEGTFTGPVEITGFDIVIGPSARFASNVTIYSSAEPRIDPAALIKGKLQIRPLRDSPMMLAYQDRGIVARAQIALLMAAGALLAGLFFLWLGRGVVEDSIDEFVERTGWSGLAGVLTLIFLPVLVGLLAVTLVGAPLGLFLLMALPLMLLLGLAAAGFGIGEFLLNRTGEPRSGGARALMLLVGLLILALLVLIPYAGPAVVVLATVFGLGAVLRAIRGRLKPVAEG